MKLVTSTGDFGHYLDSIEDKIKNFRGSRFKYINLEQTGTIEEFYREDDNGWKRLADKWGEAAAYAGVKLVVSHAPCLNVYSPSVDEQTYKAHVRAIRRSIEICHILGIDRTVVHPCPNLRFTPDEFYTKNKKFYEEFFDLMEKYNITLMTENWDTAINPLSTGKEMRYLAEYVNHPLMGVCWDTAHANFNSKSRAVGQYENIVALGDKLKGLHISDNFGDTHHHSWPFAGIINFDSVMQALADVDYDGYFTFEASYTLLHHKNLPYQREPWEHDGKVVTKLLDPSLEVKKAAVDLLYETGKYILSAYRCFEE